MPISKHLLFVFTFAIATTVMAKPRENTQCVSIEIPSFNLSPDVFCNISTSKLRSKLPDQVFLSELGFPPEQSCFFIVDPESWESSVVGYITDPESPERELMVTVSGVAGLTGNAYPPRNPLGTISFTAATIVTITFEGEELGSLVTRDAGTIFADFIDDRVEYNAAARLSVVKGTGDFQAGVTGYIDEVGQEFNPVDPASATGTLCGEDLADTLFDD